MRTDSVMARDTAGPDIDVGTASGPRHADRHFGTRPHIPRVPIYDRQAATAIEEIDRWEGGVGWLAHSGERGRRASHALRGDDGVWVFDPVDAPGVDDLLATVGEVAGVAVLSDYHARDAGAVARRHGVPVHVPEWFERVAERVLAPVERFAGAIGDSGIRVRRYAPFPGWREGVAHRPADGTLYVADALGSAPLYTVGEERLGVYLLLRPFPPREVFAAADPDRVLFGHGTGVFEDAADALDDALAGARRRFPRALARNGAGQLRALVGALG